MISSVVASNEYLEQKTVSIVFGEKTRGI